MLTFEHVTKKYRSGTVAVNDVSLTLGAGIVGLLGPNGAGKTTLMQMVAALTRPTAGRILFQGTDVHRKPDLLRSRLGYLPQDFGVYESVTALEFLSFMAGLKGVRSRARVMQALEAVNLHTVAANQIRTFSGGMKQRLGIAQALVNDPGLLIVDEPTTGLDPEERVRFRSILLDLGREGLVILSTHIVSDVEAVAGTIALMRNGRLVECGPPEQLLAAAAGHVREAVLPSADFERLRPALRISSAVQKPDGVHLRFVVHETDPGFGCTVEPGLEDAYLFLTAGDRP